MVMDSLSLIVGAFLSGIVGIVTTQINSSLRERERKRIIGSALYREVEEIEGIINQYNSSFKEVGYVISLTRTLDTITKAVNKKSNGIPLNEYNPLYPSSGWYYVHKSELIGFGFSLFQKIEQFYKCVIYLNTLLIEYYNRLDKIDPSIDYEDEEIKRINLEFKETVSFIGELIPKLKDELKIYQIKK